MPWDPGFKIHRRLSKSTHKEDLDIDLGPGKGKLLDHLDLEPDQIEEIANNIHQAMKSRKSIMRGKPLNSKALHHCCGWNAHKIINQERGFVDMLWISRSAFSQIPSNILMTMLRAPGTGWKSKLAKLYLCRGRGQGPSPDCKDHLSMGHGDC